MQLHLPTDSNPSNLTTVEWGGGIFRIRHVGGLEFREKLRAFQATHRQQDGTVDSAGVTLDWVEYLFSFPGAGWEGVEDQHGTPIPCTPSTVRQLPMELIDALMEASGVTQESRYMLASMGLDVGQTIAQGTPVPRQAPATPVTLTPPNLSPDEAMQAIEDALHTARPAITR